jgi:hypothetical protein
MFRENLDFFKQICAGKQESARHVSFYKSVQSRQSLFYKMINHPFTEEQVNWTLDEIKDIWMSNIEMEKKNNDYVWKVLLSECLLKFYMDKFGFSKEEAENRMSETPMLDDERLCDTSILN